MDRGKIDSVVKLLQHLQVWMIDVNGKDWHKYNLPSLTTLQKKQLRVRVNETVEELECAYEVGFEKFIFACTLTPGGDLTPPMNALAWAAEKREVNIGLCIENASDFSLAEIEGLWRAVSTMGVTTFIYSDGYSRLNPLSTFKILTSLREKMPIALEFHAHNAYGLATANAFGAMQAGVKYIATAVAGVGVQGQAAMEEVMMIQKRLLGKKNLETETLSYSCSKILSSIGVKLPATKAIIGEDIFAHESGIHVDGVLKNPQLYEIFPPEEVGATRKLVLGKHSGTASIQAKLQQRNIVLSDVDAQCLLKQVRRLAVIHKKAIEDEMLWKMYQDWVV
jgi:homocitrate synthase NifV